MLRAIEDQFAIAFPRRVWVFGTVRGLRGQDGQLEFLLVEAGSEASDDTAPRTLPSEMDPGFAADWHVAEDDTARKRVVVDQVASLTDQSALAWHGRLVR